MSEPKVYALEVQGDFVTKQTHAKPVQALAELIWNSLDADATSVEIREDVHGVGEPRIVIVDNGTGFSHDEAPELFRRLGGSWKHRTGETRQRHRFMHGSEGKGRFKALAVGRVVDWEVCSQAGKVFTQFTVSIVEDSLREVRITDPQPAKQNRPGVKCIISELHKAYEFLRSEQTVQELSELFATYLKNYTDVQISLPAGKLDIGVAIVSSKTFPLSSVSGDGVEYPVALEVIEWKNPTDRAVYLCNEAGFPLSQADVRLHAPGFNFSAYLKSAYISKLSNEGLLGLAEMNPELTQVLAEAKDAIKAFHQERGIEKAQTVVEKWKDEQVYPYKSEPQTLVESIEREVFNIVAVKVNNLIQDFDAAPQKGKRLQLRMLRQAIEKSPEELQLILTEVLDLPEKKQKEFAKLLQETSLTAIISASKVVADRLKFMTGLDALLFDVELKKGLRERTQLHRLLAENTWIFGEEFFLSVDDQSLTEVLRKHLKAKGLDVAVDEPVRRLDGSVGIVDLMLTRNIPCHRENELEHLVVELKRPTVKIGDEEISQIKSYAFSVIKDERFLGIETRWTFWIVSNEMDEFAKQEAHQAHRPAGLLYQSDDRRVAIWAKTWSEVLHANRQRLKLFQDSLELNANRTGSLAFLRETYANILGATEQAPVESDETPAEALAE